MEPHCLHAAASALVRLEPPAPGGGVARAAFKVILDNQRKRPEETKTDANWSHHEWLAAAESSCSAVWAHRVELSRVDWS